jgi:hypothetical protein
MRPSLHCDSCGVPLTLGQVYHGEHGGEREGCVLCGPCYDDDNEATLRNAPEGDDVGSPAPHQ